MPSRIPEPLTERLREANSRLEYWLDSLVPEPGPEPARPGYVRPQQMAALLSELMRTGEWLRALPPKRDESLEQELAEYHRKVERLRDLMPSIHATLLRERARLERERGRMDSALAWAQSSRQTL